MRPILIDGSRHDRGHAMLARDPSGTTKTQNSSGEQRLPILNYTKHCAPRPTSLCALPTRLQPTRTITIRPSPGYNTRLSHFFSSLVHVFHIREVPKSNNPPSNLQPLTTLLRHGRSLPIRAFDGVLPIRIREGSQHRVQESSRRPISFRRPGKRHGYCNLTITA